MAKELEIGDYAVSKAGHDFGKIYVIFDMDKEYLYLVDGKIRTLDNQKKKKRIHIDLVEQSEKALSEKVKNRTVKNEEIKRALKLLHVNRSKEVEGCQRPM